MSPSHPFATAPSGGSGLSKFDSLFDETSTLANPRSRTGTLSPVTLGGTKANIPNFGERPSSASFFTSTETLAFEELFNQTEGLEQGYLTGDQAVPLFQRSGLNSTTLSQIWQLADSKGEGILRLANFKVAMKLISLAQAHRPVSLAYLQEACPLPLFDGVRLSLASVGRRADDVRSGRTSSHPRVSPFGAKPASPFDPPLVTRTINLTDAQKYYRIFLKASFNQDLLDGNLVRDIMVKTGLPIDTLRDIWNIADTQGRGCLEAFEFIIAMFYVENILNETLVEVPALLPPKIKDSAISAVTAMTSSPISRQSSFPAPTSSRGDWAIPPAEVQKYGGFFDAIVPLPTGLMSSDDAYKFFIRSKLPSPTLSAIWELSCILGQDGLTRDEFAVAMHLIYATMAGAPLPRQLSQDLIPPSLRKPDPFLQAIPQPQPPFDPFLTKELPRTASPMPQDLLSFDNQQDSKDEILALNAQLMPLIQDINACRTLKAQLQAQKETMQSQEESLNMNHSEAKELQTELTRELSELELLHKELIPIHSSTQEKHRLYQTRFQEAQLNYTTMESKLQGELAKSQDAKLYIQTSQATIAHLTSQLSSQVTSQTTSQAEPEELDPFTALIEDNPPRATHDPFSESLSFDDLVATKRAESVSSHISCHSRIESKPESGSPFPPKPDSPISERSADIPLAFIKPSPEPEFDPFTALISEFSNPQHNPNMEISQEPANAQIRTQEDLVNYFSAINLDQELIHFDLAPSENPQPTALSYQMPPSLFDSFTPTFSSPRPLYPSVAQVAPLKSLADPFLDMIVPPEPKTPSAFDQAFGERRASMLGTLSFDDIFGESFSAPNSTIDPANIPLPVSTSGSITNIVPLSPFSPATLSALAPDDSHSASVYFDAEDEINRCSSTPAPSLTLQRAAATSEPSAFPQVDPAAMQELLGMGFTTHQATEALAKYDNNLELATNHLLDISPGSA